MKIKITPVSEEAELLLPPPKRAADSLPEWFKNAPMHEPGYDGNKASRLAVGTSRTVKGCNPFLDTLTGGYMFTLAADVEFQFLDGEFVPRWLVDVDLVDGQAPFQASPLPQISKRSSVSWKWLSGWMLSTPKGYSTLFTHPLNRHDLPFRTFSGIVETDTYKIQTDFPFQLLTKDSDNSIFIEKGTPICQAIPFKRDNWSSEIMPFDEKERSKSLFSLYSKMNRSYRNEHWERKVYN